MKVGEVKRKVWYVKARAAEPEGDFSPPVLNLEPNLIL